MSIYIRLFILLIITSSNSYASHLVKEITDDAKIILENGNIIKLNNIYFPQQIMTDSVLFMRQNLINKKIDIELDEAKKNSYGVYKTDEIYYKKRSLLSDLLGNGLVLIYSTNIDYKVNDEHKLQELNAYKKNIGLWSNYQLFVAEDELLKNYKKYISNFVVTSAKVESAKLVKDNMYINFGNDWKTDLTVKIKKKNLKNFKQIDFNKLNGKRLLVRGWIEDYNGPMVEIYNISHLDII